MVPQRGCGYRVAGALYLEVPTSVNGKPIEYFLVDPPERTSKIFALNNVSLSPKGVNVIRDENGIIYLFDIVGKGNGYPNPADFIEEARRFGISRRISRKLDLTGLTGDSWLFLIHDRAWVDNISDYGVWRCPSPKQEIVGKHYPEGIKEGDCCAGFWWQDIDPSSAHENVKGRQVKRIMPSFNYGGYLRPQGVIPLYQQAIFLRFPLKAANLAVVKGPGEEESLEAASRSGLEVHIVDE